MVADTVGLVAAEHGAQVSVPWRAPTAQRDAADGLVAMLCALAPTASLPCTVKVLRHANVVQRVTQITVVWDYLVEPDQKAAVEVAFMGEINAAADRFFPAAAPVPHEPDAEGVYARRLV